MSPFAYNVGYAAGRIFAGLMIIIVIGLLLTVLLGNYEQSRDRDRANADVSLSMDPPVIEVVSEWNGTGVCNYRYIKIDGQLAIEVRGTPGYSSAMAIYPPNQTRTIRITQPTPKD